MIVRCNNFGLYRVFHAWQEFLAFFTRDCFTRGSFTRGCFEPNNDTPKEGTVIHIHKSGDRAWILRVPKSGIFWCQKFFFLCVGCFLLMGCAHDSDDIDWERAAPEPAHTLAPPHADGVLARRRMVVAAHPLATRAGLDILRQGGSAIDAALAVQLVLNLVEPQSSGIGGGAFLLYYDAATGDVYGYDGRETAPSAIEPTVFLDAEGQARSFYDAAIGGVSVGVPGVLALLEAAHQRHGRLPWDAAFAPAIALAEDGFRVTPRLNSLLDQDRFLRDDPEARALYYRPDGTAVPVGMRLRNPAFADTLRALSGQGAGLFYRGDLSDSIVTAVRTAWRNPGFLRRRDLVDYQAKMRPPLCRPYRVWRICSFPPPTSGGVTLLQVLGILETIDLSTSTSLDPQTLHWMTEAGRLAYADRDRYLADSDFVAVPVSGLLEKNYLQDRAALLTPDRSLGRAQPGRPPDGDGSHFIDGQSGAQPSTSHFVIRDEWGNAVSMTSSIESAFGARVMVGGFLLNNQLTDFSFDPETDNGLVANRVEPGKRPRSSMTPVMVFDAEGRLVLLTGSPGGSRIINYVLEHLVRILDFGLEPHVAMALPHIGSRNGPTEMEAGRSLEDQAAALSNWGHEIRFSAMTSGLHTIQILPDGRLLGAADPRREGIALGD